MSKSIEISLTSLRKRVPRRRGAAVPIIIAGTVALGCLAFLMYWSFFRSSNEIVVDAILKPVIEGEFVAKVLDQGEVQSAENVEIKCQVGSRNGNVTVIDAVKEGSKVYGGDWLVTLDSTAFEKELEQQKLAVSNAQTQVIQSVAQLEAAKASKEEYLEGTFLEQLRTIDNDIFNAQQTLTESEAFLDHSVKLQAKGFITKQQLRTDQIALEKAKNSLELALQRKSVLEKITKKKDVILLDSDIAAAEVAVKNAEESKRIEENQLEEVEQQLDYCSIVVPEGVSGEVVYHKEFDRRGGSEWVLEPGAQVRERQVLIKLPNQDKMEIKVLINEQSITAIQEKMPATISVDALPNVNLKGYVTRVNSYAEQGGWGSSSAIREYAVFVRIIDPPRELIPGMNASVTIQTEFQADVLQAPLQCIYAANDTNFVLRKTGENTFETTEVKIAGENSINVWIEGGVNKGDMLVMDPGQYRELMDLPEQDVDDQIKLPEGAEEAATKEKAEEVEASKKASAEKRKSMEGKSKKSGQRKAKGGSKSKGDSQGKDVTGGGKSKRGGGPGGGGGSMDSRIDDMMSRYDSNSDGKIDSDEFAEIDGRFSGFLKRADADGDGEYTREEIKKFFDNMAKQFGGGGGGGGRPPGR